MRPDKPWDVRWIILPKLLIDGEISGWSEMLALRRVKGQWQYRRATPEEIDDHRGDQW